MLHPQRDPESDAGFIPPYDAGTYRIAEGSGIVISGLDPAIQRFRFYKEDLDFTNFLSRTLSFYNFDPDNLELNLRNLNTLNEATIRHIVGVMRFIVESGLPADVLTLNNRAIATTGLSEFTLALIGDSGAEYPEKIRVFGLRQVFVDFIQQLRHFPAGSDIAMDNVRALSQHLRVQHTEVNLPPISPLG